MSIVSPNGARANPPQRLPRTRSGTPIYLRGSSQVVGHVNGTWFEKSIAGSRHLLRRPEALAFDASTLDDAERAGAESVAVRDVETGTVYRQRISTIRQYGFSITRGFGRQIALPLTAYSINGQPPELALGVTAVTNQERKQVQLQLLGGAA